jgi:hypothetical protein
VAFRAPPRARLSERILRCSTVTSSGYSGIGSLGDGYDSPGSSSGIIRRTTRGQRSTTRIDSRLLFPARSRPRMTMLTHPRHQQGNLRSNVAVAGRRAWCSSRYLLTTLKRCAACDGCETAEATAEVCSQGLSQHAPADGSRADTCLSSSQVIGGRLPRHLFSASLPNHRPAAVTGEGACACQCADDRGLVDWLLRALKVEHRSLQAAFSFAWAKSNLTIKYS